MHLRFLHGSFDGFMAYFFLLLNVHPFVWVPWFILFTCGTISWLLPTLTLMNKAVIYTCEQVLFVHKFSTPLGKYHGEGPAGPNGKTYV